MRFTLPYPPSVNHLWRMVGSRMLISREGRQYRDRVLGALIEQGVSLVPMTGRLSVFIKATMPDRRKRDIDNVVKAVLDSVGKAGVYEDDCQIDRLVIERGEVDGEGIVTVEINETGA